MSASRQRKIQELVEKAAQALAKAAPFEAERSAAKAVALARQEGDFELMAKIVPQLQQARMRRFEEALKIGQLTIVAGPVPDDVKVAPGCYLVQPPQVGADARRMRQAAMQSGTAAAVLCREPLTRMRLQPLVAISPGATIRAKVDPPANAEKPSLDWFVEAMEALGNAAIEDLDPALAPIKRVDALLDRLDAISEHQNLHIALAAACREAQKVKDQSPEAAAVEAGDDEDDAEDADGEGGQDGDEASARTKLKSA